VSNLEAAIRRITPICSCSLRLVGLSKRNSDYLNPLSPRKLLALSEKRKPRAKVLLRTIGERRIRWQNAQEKGFRYQLHIRTRHVGNISSWPMTPSRLTTEIRASRAGRCTEALVPFTRNTLTTEATMTLPTYCGNCRFVETTIRISLRELDA